MNHLIESQQFDRELIFSLFALAEKFRTASSQPLRGKILATLFYEPSTRTRLSFESAMLKLGGNVISTENAQEFSSAVKGESLADTIRIVAAYADAVVLRHYEPGAAQTAANISPVPIINAGDGAGQHPTQALLDLYTIWKELGRVDNITVVFVGDLKYGRTVRSLCYLLGKFERITIIFIAPHTLTINDDIKSYLQRHKITFKEQESLEKALPLVDIVYMTRIQKERMSPAEYAATKKKYTITEDNLQLLQPQARLLHPLPHVEEIQLSINTEQKDNRVAYFRQAANGLYIRMALLYYLLNNKN